MLKRVLSLALVLITVISLSVTTQANSTPTYVPAGTSRQQLEEIRAVLDTYSPDTLLFFRDVTKEDVPLADDYEITYFEDGSYSIDTQTINMLLASFIFTNITLREKLNLELMEAIKGVKPYNLNEDLFLNMEISVHEAVHLFQKGNDHLVNNMVIKVGRVPKGDIVKTEAVTANLSEELRTTRWNKYVSAKASVTANQDGIYGLLDELEAYYFGYKALQDATDYVLNYLDKNGYYFEIVKSYLTHAVNIMNMQSAFYEFTFWTVEYLLFIRDNYPDYYRDIMANDAYRYVFKCTYEAYKELVEVTAPKNVQTVLNKISSLGVVIEEREISSAMQIALREEGSNITQYISKGELVKPYVKALSAVKGLLATPRYSVMLNELLDVPESVLSAYTNGNPPIPQDQIESLCSAHTEYRTIWTDYGVWKFYGDYTDFVAVYFDALNEARFLYTNKIIDTVGSTLYTDTNDNNKVYAASIGNVPDDSSEVIEQIIFELTNAFRGTLGLAPYKWNDKLALAAKVHCQDMLERNFIDHTNPDGTTLYDRVTAAGYWWAGAGENIAQGSKNVVTTFDAWINSAPHRAGIVDPRFEDTGIGWESNGNFATQVFGLHLK